MNGGTIWPAERRELRDLAHGGLMQPASHAGRAGPDSVHTHGTLHGLLWQCLLVSSHFNYRGLWIIQLTRAEAGPLSGAARAAGGCPSTALPWVSCDDVVTPHLSPLRSQADYALLSTTDRPVICSYKCFTLECLLRVPWGCPGG